MLNQSGVSDIWTSDSAYLHQQKRVEDGKHELAQIIALTVMALWATYCLPTVGIIAKMCGKLVTSVAAKYVSNLVAS